MGPGSASRHFVQAPSGLDTIAGVLEYQGGLRSTHAAGIGSAVTDLIFYIAKRDVTFFSGTAPISFL